MGATMVLKGDYPYLEPIANISESTRKVITAYETVSGTNDPNSCTWNTPTLSCPLSHFLLNADTVKYSLLHIFSCYVIIYFS